MAIVLLICGVFFGVMASHSYSAPGFWKSWLGFIKLRPLHVSSVVFWILLSAQALVNIALKNITQRKIPAWINWSRIVLIFIGIISIFICYFNLQFGGREYWEFPAWIAIPLLLVWLLQLAGMLFHLRHIPSPPVYIWMWYTGCTFLVFTFLENYLWLVPGIQNTPVRDLMFQWKSAGSLVGSWNQMIYGLGMYAMVQITGNTKPASSPLAFSMYFLGLVNLMFNWGHHIYILPSHGAVRTISYVVSMTEWIILLRLFYLWLKEFKRKRPEAVGMALQFLMAADRWVLINLLLALLMSVPALNLYTHGTQVTLAHSMGTTIGINTMLLLGIICQFMVPMQMQYGRWFRAGFRLLQAGLIIFWAILLLSGISRGYWQMQPGISSFQSMMLQHTMYFRIMAWSGSLMMSGFYLILFPLLMKWLKNKLPTV
ncbi:MAG: cbb3-type cytochrome c oxidase subunit I [Bacteroidetes bacterium]|nr:cbb3-type cytochrome c oxidase subunit I [Bacteroidota bacterium]